jgi:hypothetical protein
LFFACELELVFVKERFVFLSSMIRLLRVFFSNLLTFVEWVCGKFGLLDFYRVVAFALIDAKFGLVSFVYSTKIRVYIVVSRVKNSLRLIKGYIYGVYVLYRALVDLRKEFKPYLWSRMGDYMDATRARNLKVPETEIYARERGVRYYYTRLLVSGIRRVLVNVRGNRLPITIFDFVKFKELFSAALSRRLKGVVVESRVTKLQDKLHRATVFKPSRWVGRVRSFPMSLYRRLFRVQAYSDFGYVNSGIKGEWLLRKLDFDPIYLMKYMPFTRFRQEIRTSDVVTRNVFPLGADLLDFDALDDFMSAQRYVYYDYAPSWWKQGTQPGLPMINDWATGVKYFGAATKAGRKFHKLMFDIEYSKVKDKIDKLRDVRTPEFRLIHSVTTSRRRHPVFTYAKVQQNRVKFDAISSRIALPASGFATILVVFATIYLVVRTFSMDPLIVKYHVLEQWDYKSQFEFKNKGYNFYTLFSEHSNLRHSIGYSTGFWPIIIDYVKVLINLSALQGDLIIRWFLFPTLRPGYPVNITDWSMPLHPIDSWKFNGDPLIIENSPTNYVLWHYLNNLSPVVSYLSPRPELYDKVYAFDFAGVKQHVNRTVGWVYYYSSESFPVVPILYRLVADAKFIFVDPVVWLVKNYWLWFVVLSIPSWFYLLSKCVFVRFKKARSFGMHSFLTSSSLTPVEFARVLHLGESRNPFLRALNKSNARYTVQMRSLIRLLMALDPDKFRTINNYYLTYILPGVDDLLTFKYHYVSLLRSQLWCGRDSAEFLEFKTYANCWIWYSRQRELLELRLTDAPTVVMYDDEPREDEEEGGQEEPRLEPYFAAVNLYYVVDSKRRSPLRSAALDKFFVTLAAHSAYVRFDAMWSRIERYRLKELNEVLDMCERKPVSVNTNSLVDAWMDDTLSVLFRTGNRLFLSNGVRKINTFANGLKPCFGLIKVVQSRAMWRFERRRHARRMRNYKLYGYHDIRLPSFVWHHHELAEVTAYQRFDSRYFFRRLMGSVASLKLFIIRRGIRRFHHSNYRTHKLRLWHLRRFSITRVEEPQYANSAKFLERFHYLIIAYKKDLHQMVSDVTSYMTELDSDDDGIDDYSAFFGNDISMKIGMESSLIPALAEQALEFGRIDKFMKQQPSMLNDYYWNSEHFNTWLERVECANPYTNYYLTFAEGVDFLTYFFNGVFFSSKLTGFSEADAPVFEFDEGDLDELKNTGAFPHPNYLHYDFESAKSKVGFGAWPRRLLRSGEDDQFFIRHAFLRGTDSQLWQMDFDESLIRSWQLPVRQEAFYLSPIEWRQFMITYEFVYPRFDEEGEPDNYLTVAGARWYGTDFAWIHYPRGYAWEPLL